MKVILNPNKETWSAILERPTKTVDDIEATVSKIFKEVQETGDVAVNKYTNQFDKVQLTSNTVTSNEIEEANKSVSQELKDAINLAYDNISKFQQNYFFYLIKSLN